jgi:beta-lactam-binding protein with PASTA domain
MDNEKKEINDPAEGFTIFSSVWRIAAIFFMGFSVFLMVSTMMLQFLTKSGTQVTVPDVTGKRFVDVYNSLIRKDIKPDLSFKDINDLDDGIILKQSPEAGSVIYENEKLKLLVSRSEILIDVPNVAGVSYAMAVNKLKNLHFNEKPVSLSIGMVTYIPSEKTADNIVISQLPPAGERVKPERRVNLLVSAGKTAVDAVMPEVTGQSVDLCYDLLLAKGVFIDIEVVQTVTPADSGIISVQSPAAGTVLKKDDIVKLKTSLYPSKEKPYSAYDICEYKIPSDEQPGIYEAYVEDNTSKRVRFYKRMKPGEIIRFPFHRNGNAKVTILRDKEKVRVLNINAD